MNQSISERKHTFENLRTELETEIRLFEVQAFNFATSFIKDARVRESYKRLISKSVSELIENLKSGRHSLEVISKQVSDMRDIVRRSHQLRSSHIGQAIAEFVQDGQRFKFHELLEIRSNSFYSKAFYQLDEFQKKNIFMSIINTASRGNANISKLAAFAGKAAKPLMVLSVGIAIYQVCEAEDKIQETKKQVLNISLGSGASYLFSQLGFLCGPAAVACVPIGFVLGGFLGAYGGEYLSEWKF